jgi:hypothetical protein
MRFMMGSPGCRHPITTYTENSCFVYIYLKCANINETALFHLSLSDGFSVWAIFIIAGGVLARRGNASSGRAGLTRVCRAAATTCPPFKGRHRPHLIPDLPMPSAKVRASTILGAFEQAETELVGKAVILTNGTAGTVEHVWLDELHGLLLSIRGHDGKWPVSTVKFAQS